MSDFTNYLNKELKNPAFKREWEVSEPEFNIIQAIIIGILSKNLTQKHLAEITGISQTEIRELEKGNDNPSLSTLKKLADGMDMVLKVEMIPKKVVQ